MPVTTYDLNLFCSANMPESDSGTSGGAIDKDSRPIFTDISAVDGVEILSSNNNDTAASITIYGRRADGLIISETKSLLGSGIVFTTSNFERILKATLSVDCSGVVTVRKASDNVTIGQIPNGERTFRRLGYDNYSLPTGSGNRVIYEKIFCQNGNAVSAFLNAQIAITSDPSGLVAFRLEDQLNGSNSSASRTTLPSNLDSNSWDDSYKSIPSGYIGASGTGSDHIGIWVRTTIPENYSPGENTFQISIDGRST